MCEIVAGQLDRTRDVLPIPSGNAANHVHNEYHRRLPPATAQSDQRKGLVSERRSVVEDALPGDDGSDEEMDHASGQLGHNPGTVDDLFRGSRHAVSSLTTLGGIPHGVWHATSLQDGQPCVSSLASAVKAGKRTWTASHGALHSDARCKVQVNFSKRSLHRKLDTPLLRNNVVYTISFLSKVRGEVHLCTRKSLAPH